MLNPWGWRSGKNPYKWNAYTCLRATPADLSPARISKKAKAMLNRIKYKPDEAKVYGRQVNEIEVTQSIETLKSPNKRVVEDLFCHKPHFFYTKKFIPYINEFSELRLEGCKCERVPPFSKPSALVHHVPLKGAGDPIIIEETEFELEGAVGEWEESGFLV